MKKIMSGAGSILSKQAMQISLFLFLILFPLNFTLAEYETPVSQFQSRSTHVLVARVIQFVHQRLDDDSFGNFLILEPVKMVKGTAPGPEMVIRCDCNLNYGQLVLVYLKKSRDKSLGKWFRSQPLELIYLSTGEIRQPPSEMRSADLRLDFDEEKISLDLKLVPEQLLGKPSGCPQLVAFLREKSLVGKMLANRDEEKSGLLSLPEPRRIDQVGIMVPNGLALSLDGLKANEMEELNNLMK